MGFSLAMAKGGHSLVAVPEFLIAGAPLVAKHRLGGAWASAAATHGLSSCGFWALEHRLNRCGSRASLLGGMWDLPGLGIEPVSCIGRWILYHRATREAQDIYRFKDQY